MKMYKITKKTFAGHETYQIYRRRFFGLWWEQIDTKLHISQADAEKTVSLFKDRDAKPEVIGYY